VSGAIGFVIYDRPQYLKPLVSKFGKLQRDLAAAHRELADYFEAAAAAYPGNPRGVANSTPAAWCNSDADNDRLRALEPEINDVIRQDLPLRYAYVPEADAVAERGLIRNRSVAPPPASDGTVRIVEIVGLDRQACGGTHLASTGASRPIRILKIDNKGRHNRRIRIGLADPRG